MPSSESPSGSHAPVPSTRALRRFFPSRLERGHRTETAALGFLHERGCRLVARNVRYRVGEIDLVVRDGDCLVFVEVRGRGEGSLETAAVALPFPKRLKLWRAIERYLLLQPESERRRFRRIRVDFLSTDGERWFWYRNVELKRAP